MEGDPGRNQEWSITLQAKNAGFELFKEAIESFAVADSYAAACDLADVTTRLAFQTLSRLARREINSHPCVPYIRLFFSRPGLAYTGDGESIGIRVERPLKMGGNLLLKAGSGRYPWGVVPRSWAIRSRQNHPFEYFVGVCGR